MNGWKEALNDDRLAESVRDISLDAVITLSSCCGVHQLLDEDMGTFWQSDGAQPHFINMQLARKTPLAAIAIYTDYKVDESYTPSRISIRVGNHENDMRQVSVRELDEPNGWIVIDLRTAALRPTRAFLVQVVVLQNHQNGRDTHIRHVKLLSPLRSVGEAMDSAMQMSGVTHTLLPILNT